MVEALGYLGFGEVKVVNLAIHPKTGISLLYIKKSDRRVGEMISFVHPIKKRRATPNPKSAALLMHVLPGGRTRQI